MAVEELSETLPGGMTFEEKVVVMLKRRGMSHAELARRIGSNPNSVSNWLTKGWKPRFDTAAKIAQALGVPLDYLARDDWPSGDWPTRMVLNGIPQMSEVPVLSLLSSD